MMERNFIPKAQRFADADSQARLPEAFTKLVSGLTDFVSSIVSFLVAEHPRGPMPQGPVAIGAVAKATTTIVSWRGDASGATVDHYAIYRADAGTSGSPTTPAFSAASRVGVVPTARRPRQNPVSSKFTWVDGDFSAADQSDGRRFSYWATAVDNESRESVAVPIGATVTVPPAGGGGAGSDVLDWLGF